MSHRFSTATELLELAGSTGLGIARLLLERDAERTGMDEDAIRAELAHRILVTRRALEKGLRSPQRSLSGLTEGAAPRVAASPSPPVADDFFNKAIAYALAVNEVNACGGKVVAFPTAGSCGIVPGVLWAWRDAREPGLGPDSRALQDAFTVSAAIGILIAARATLSGAAGGCQAECGAAAAMAAAGLRKLMGAADADCVDAAALSLKNCLGLACDPVAGLVEVPCVKRNAFMAANAVTAATLAAAGVRSAIPFDEVVGAMRAIGDALPSSLRESSEGGLAVTPTGLAAWERIK